MANIDRAAEIIEDRLARWEVTHYEPNSDYLAQALADAGLLAPDLPEPDGFCVWDMDNLVVRVDRPTRNVRLEYVDPYEGQEVHMFSDEAREVALFLLAAADYAERNQA
ncbi:hypothetical protein [Acidipropionibacterium jensenii]|jgi:hypothetical protein|uniref:hypothetical protein n=1 Tax=Acidipropionibacterium jensenii TaxID=1749 RepID=UPI00264936C0|nr:hypothetical protein [Acidipropionibacterium jensenii]MDN6428183.1 hypothetical protein [Acidipropionibacterium jensenii]